MNISLLKKAAKYPVKCMRKFYNFVQIKRFQVAYKGKLEINGRIYISGKGISLGKGVRINSGYRSGIVASALIQ